MVLLIFISECTFIVIDKTLEGKLHTTQHQNDVLMLVSEMAGDVNLFFIDDDEHHAELEVYHHISPSFTPHYPIYSLIK